MTVVKGYELPTPRITDTHDRRALQTKNKILEVLRQLELTEDDADIPLINSAFRKAPASALWYFEGYRLYYSYTLCNNFAENLLMVYYVIKRHIDALLNGEITFQKFISEFSEDDDVEKQRKEARVTLGLEEHETDMDIIDKKYKDLAKQHHPDMPGGDVDMFKAINRAHKILRRQLQ